MSEFYDFQYRLAQERAKRAEVELDLAQKNRMLQRIYLRCAEVSARPRLSDVDGGNLTKHRPKVLDCDREGILSVVGYVVNGL